MDSLDRGRPCGQPSVLHGAASRGAPRDQGTPVAGAVGSTTYPTGRTTTGGIIRGRSAVLLLVVALATGRRDWRVRVKPSIPRPRSSQRLTQLILAERCPVDSLQELDDGSVVVNVASELPGAVDRDHFRDGDLVIEYVQRLPLIRMRCLMVAMLRASGPRRLDESCASLRNTAIRVCRRTTTMTVDGLTSSSMAFGSTTSARVVATKGPSPGSTMRQYLTSSMDGSGIPMAASPRGSRQHPTSTIHGRGPIDLVAEDVDILMDKLNWVVGASNPAASGLSERRQWHGQPAELGSSLPQVPGGEGPRRVLAFALAVSRGVRSHCLRWPGCGGADHSRAGSVVPTPGPG